MASTVRHVSKLMLVARDRVGAALPSEVARAIIFAAHARMRRAGLDTISTADSVWWATYYEQVVHGA